MKRADLIITKAGGITTLRSRSLRKRLCILSRPFLEQEFGNAKYIEEHNIGRVPLGTKSADECERHNETDRKMICFSLR